MKNVTAHAALLTMMALPASANDFTVGQYYDREGSCVQITTHSTGLRYTRFRKPGFHSSCPKAEISGPCTPDSAFPVEPTAKFEVGRHYRLNKTDGCVTIEKVTPKHVEWTVFGTSGSDSRGRSLPVDLGEACDLDVKAGEWRRPG